MVINVNLGHRGFLELDKIAPVETMSGYVKPDGGLWGCTPEAEYSWEQFCAVDYTGGLSKEHAEVYIKDDSKILTLDSKEAVEKFIDKYSDNRWPYPTIDYAKVASDYDVVDYKYSNFLREMEFGSDMYFYVRSLDVDSTAILNRDAVEKIVNPETVTFYSKTEQYFIQTAGVSCEDGADVGVLCYNTFSTEEERKEALRAYKEIFKDEKRYQSALCVIEKYGRLRDEIMRYGGNINERTLNTVLLDIGMQDDAERIISVIKDDVFKHSQGEMRNNANNFGQKFEQEYIHGCRPWRVVDLKIRWNIFDKLKVEPSMKDAVCKEVLRAVLREPAFNTWKEVSGRIPAIVNCLSA